MEKSDAARNSQKYRAVKDEDYEDTALDESGNETPSSAFATHGPYQNGLYSAAKFLICREVLVVHFVWLLLLILSVFGLQFWTSRMACAVSNPQAQHFFGEIPYRVVTFEENKAFIESDPMEGKHWNRSRETGNYWTPWDDIHPGSWVRVKPSPSLGVTDGIPLREFSRDGSWDTDEEGFALSMHHQIHCLGLMKHVFLKSERNQTVTPLDYRHMDHCVEYIRQAVMCHGDLTLEPLLAGSTRTKIESDTWGSKHFCRDWNVLKQVVWKHTSIGWDDHGFVYDDEIV
ncbi:hypothetical protein GGR57DRAFT_466025 [Xylariaceae sp. FL1272]|nr:hypothetical protein GGR57DRAFT_466025 [Xylariaceae sp. FL1272]